MSQKHHFEKGIIFLVHKRSCKNAIRETKQLTTNLQLLVNESYWDNNLKVLLLNFRLEQLKCQSGELQ